MLCSFHLTKLSAKFFFLVLKRYLFDPGLIGSYDCSNKGDLLGTTSAYRVGVLPSSTLVPHEQ